jgi:hypothetical protein
VCGLWTRSTAQLGDILASEAEARAQKEAEDKARREAGAIQGNGAAHPQDVVELVKQFDPESPLYPSRYSKELELQWMWNRD